MRYLQLLRTNAVASSKQNQLPHISVNTAVSITLPPTQEELKDSSSEWTTLRVIRELSISDEDFFRINKINDDQISNYCWLCWEPNYDKTAFCQKHFNEWQEQYFPLGLKHGLDICQFSYAHVDYKGARLPHGTRKLVRNWLAC